MSQTMATHDVVDEKLPHGGPSEAETNHMMKREGLSKKLLACSLMCYLTAFNFGYNNAIIGSTLGQANFYKYFTDIDPTTTRGGTLIATIVGMVSLGGAFGVLFNGFVNDTFGRRYGFLCTSFFTLLGCGLTAGARNVTMLCFGRLISGFGSWGGINVAIVYVQELAPNAYRGEFGVGIGPALNAAYFTAGWVQVGFYYVDSPINWRIPLIITAAWATLVGIGFFLIPESPRWLIWKDRSDDALRVFETLHADPRDPEHLLAREEHFAVSKQVALDKTLPSSWFAMFGRYWRRSAAATIVTFTNQACGIQVITNYGPTLYAAAGLTGGIPLIVQGAWLTWANISAIFWATQIDKLGRRPLFLWNCVTMALTFSIIIGLYAEYVDHAATASNLKAGQSALIFSFFPFVFFYEMSEPTEFLYIGEIFPMHIRAKGVALGLFSLNITAFWATIAFPNGTLTGGYKYFFLYLGCIIISIPLQYIFVKESKGYTLEEMAIIWGNPDEVAIFSKDIKLSAVIAEEQAHIGAGGAHGDHKV